MAEQLARAHETPDAVLLTSAGADFRAGRVRDAAGPASPEAYTRRDWDFRRLYRDPRDADPRGGGDRGARDGVWDLKQLRQQR